MPSLLTSVLAMTAIACDASAPSPRSFVYADGRGTPHRKRHGKVAANRRKAKAARQARKR